MSACKNKRRSRSRWGALLALGAALPAFAVAIAVGQADEKAKPDTAKVVRSISISADGIVIEGRAGESGEADTLTIIGIEKATAAAAARAEEELRRAEEELRRLEELRIIEHDTQGHDIVRFGEDIHVRADKRIRGSVVAIGGSVDIEGQVVGDVVAVGGCVTLESGASVTGDAVAVGGFLELLDGSEIRGDAVSVGGKILEHEGAHVAGDAVSVGFVPVPSFIFTGLGARSGMRAMGVTAWAVWVVVVLLLSWASAAIFPARVQRMVDKAGSSVWLSAFVGFAVVIALPLVFILLLVTLIGIPLAFILPIVLALASIVAYAVGAGLLGYRFGSRLVSKAPAELSLAQAVVLGVLIIGVAFLAGKMLGLGSAIFWPLKVALVLAAGLAAVFVYLTGLGSLLLTRFGGSPKPVLVPGGPVAGTTPASEPLTGAPPPAGESRSQGGSPSGDGSPPEAAPPQG